MKTYVIGKVIGKTDVRCKCGGQVAVEASGWRQVPIGFGFRGGKFVIDSGRYFGYFGFCMGKCRASNVFAPTGKKRLVTKTPRGINAKLEAANADA